MPVSTLNKPILNFTRGKITEQSDLLFDSNSAKVLGNIELNLDGSVKRRLGFEDEGSISTGTNIVSYASEESDIVSTYLWRSVAGTPGFDILVVYHDIDQLSFFRNNEELVKDNYLATITLTRGPETPEGTRGPKGASFSSGKGYLYVVGSALEPSIVSYDIDTTSFSSETISLKIRDFRGIPEDFAVDFRPLVADMTTGEKRKHLYNLYNQGWPNSNNPSIDSIIVASDAEGSHAYFLKTSLIGYYISKSGGRYPSNSDPYPLGKTTSAEDIAAIGGFSPWTLNKLSIGNTEAPKGHFIIDPFERTREYLSSAGVVRSVSDQGAIYDRPTTVSFFAGRAWFSGVHHEDMSGTVFFSRTIRDIFQDSSRCYQDQDPTAENLNALLATDGGVIEVPDCGTVQGLAPLGSIMLIIGSNGVWSVKGGDNTGFTAESFSVEKVSSIGCQAPSSIVEADSSVLYFSDRGVIQISLNEIGLPQTTNISERTIQTDFYTIPVEKRALARGFFDSVSNKIIWGYSLDSDDTSLSSTITRFIILDLRLGAFYDFSTDTLSGEKEIVGFTINPGFGFNIDIENVTVNGGIVTVNGEIVTTETEVSNTSNLATKAIYLDGLAAKDIRFAEISSGTFLDWGSFDYTSEIITGSDSLEEAARDKSVVYITNHFNRTEENFVFEEGELVLDNQSGCLMQGRWDFSDSDNSGKWSSENQVYRLGRIYIPETASPFDYGYGVISTKNRLRGNGKALALRYSSETGKDFQLLGWEILYKAKRRV